MERRESPKFTFTLENKAVCISNRSRGLHNRFYKFNSFLISVIKTLNPTRKYSVCRGLKCISCPQYKSHFYTDATFKEVHK